MAPFVLHGNDVRQKTLHMGETMTLAGKHGPRMQDLGEFGLINLISRKVRSSPAVSIGIGDDAAAFTFQEGCVALATSDMLVEGVHFDLSFCDPFRLGRKSLAVNLSDMAAMGAAPNVFLLSLAIPETLPVDFIELFTAGMLGLADEHGAVLAGGDTCASRGGLVISVTLLGEQRSDRILQRRGARPGDGVFVTGTLGDSALGLELLMNGHGEGSCITRHLDPTPRVWEGQALAEAGLPTAMIDLSDGLLSDLGHILESSRVGARLHLERIPLSREFAAHVASLPERDYSLAISGGEDYELLFTSPSHRREAIRSLFAKLGTPVTEIGEITDDSGRTVLLSEGRQVTVDRTGFDHFRGRTQLQAPGGRDMGR